MVSPAYSRDYRDWIANGNFDRVYEHAREDLQFAIESQRPDLVAPALRDFSLCYYTRGAASLLAGDQNGWHDIQCGYVASFDAIRFALPLMTGLDAELKNSAKYVIHAVMTLGLSRVFSLERDEKHLRNWLDTRYDVATLTGEVHSGRAILDSIYHFNHGIDAETLRHDRTLCCPKRDSWPTRPTEIPPFGILDIEMTINFPNDAAFPYCGVSYLPTEDDLVALGKSTFHA